jgi:hypothetical protein
MRLDLRCRCCVLPSRTLGMGAFSLLRPEVLPTSKLLAGTSVTTGSDCFSEGKVLAIAGIFESRT